MSQLTIDSASQSIYENLLTTMVQDIVARTTTQAQTLRARYGKSPEPYYYDASGNLDIQGMPKQQESSLYFHCDHCNRDVSVNRFAAHVERCLSRGRRG